MEYNNNSNDCWSIIDWHVHVWWIDKLFTEADVDGDSQISAEEAKNFFPRFGVPTPVLGNIWRMSSRTKGGLTREEFKTSMRHIYAFMFSASFQPIRTTPSPGPLDPSPSSSPVPIANSAFDFSISLQERQAYEKHFFTVSQGMPYVTGMWSVSFIMMFLTLHFQRSMLYHFSRRHRLMI